MIPLEAFSHLLRQCFGKTVIPEKIMIALLGGVDSICLAYLMTKYRESCHPKLQISAITVDHRYRDGSSEEAKAIGQMVQKWGIDHHIHTLNYGNLSSGNISNFEEVARTKRYEGFQSVCNKLGILALLVAHNFDDQLETYMQRVQQNSTVFGLTGLKRNSLIPLQATSPFNVTPPISVLRPLLDFTKKDIIATCEENGVGWFEDHTNQDISLTDRNLYRYLINDYIPKQLLVNPNSDLRLIDRESLTSGHRQAVELAQYAHDQVQNLNLKLKDDIELLPEHSMIKLTMETSDIENNGPLVLGRFFYELMYPVSPSKNYHWSFSKILNNFIPRLLEFITSDKPSAKFTYLNVLMDIKKQHDVIYIKFTRQPIIRLDVSEIKQSLNSSHLNQWILFDRRYWLYFKAQHQDIDDIEILPYEPKVHRKLLVDQFGDRKVPKKITPGTPIILVNKEYYALPTFDLSPSVVDIEWALKDNIYTYIDQ